MKTPVLTLSRSLCLVFVFYIVGIQALLAQKKPQEEILGAWEYQMEVCSMDGSEKQTAAFVVYIQKESVTEAGNILECNSMWASCKITSDKIIFDKKEGITHTLLDCPQTHELCGNNAIYFDFLFDMGYEVIDDILILKSGESEITLRRHIDEEE